MIRTKIPGGLADAPSRCGRWLAWRTNLRGGKGHLTTRQNMQYHFVPLAQVPDLLHMLADVRLTTREACYNTVRNVTACPLAGLASRRAVRCAALRPAAGVRVPAQGADRQPAAQIQGRVLRLPGGLHGHGHQRRGSARGDSRRSPGFRMTVAGGLGPLPTEAKASARIHSRRGHRPPRGSGHPGVQRPRQSQGQEQGAVEVRDARARLRLAARHHRGAISGHPGQWRHPDAGGGPRRFRWFSATTHHRRDRATSCRCSTRHPGFQANGAKPTSARRSRPAMRSSP